MIEHRYSQLQSRQGIIEGYALLWNEAARIPAQGLEEFTKDSIKFDDVTLRWMHDDKSCIGNTASGTLTLESDNKGLKYKARLPKSRPDIIESVERGDVQGVSVGFRCLEDDIINNVRTINKANLIELSLVDKPAHKTTMSMRNKSQNNINTRRYKPSLYEI